MASTTNEELSTPLKIRPSPYSLDDTPRSAIGARLVVLQPRTRTTLQELWWKAEKDFNKENPKHSLGAQIRTDRQALQIAKNGVLDKWQQHYQPDTSDDANRKQKITERINNTLNVLELVGSFAGQAAASAFPPAAICFSALRFLIEAPKNIQKVYEDLEKLFRQVEKFLMQFSIYQRMDDNFGLDEALITNANKLLVQFVRICGLSIRLLEAGRWQTFRQGFKTVLFGDDGGVQVELDSFESLAKFNNELTDTITLEHVLESEENTKKILRDNSELLTGVGLLLASSNDEKTKFANRDRIKRIRKKLFGGKGPADEEMSAGTFSDDIVPNTFEIIQATSEYQRWNENDSNSTLVIWGSSGSGKSRFMDAIKQHLDGLRDRADRDLPSIYVAIFNFSEKISKVTGRKKFGNSLVPHALRVLALQVAEQSLIYAKNLDLQLEINKLETYDDDYESVWRWLGLAKLNVSPPPCLHILLDAVDAEWEDARTLLKLLSDQRETAALCIKIMLTTARTEGRTNMLTQNTSLTLSAADIKAELLPSFVRSKMTEMEIFQDLEKSSRHLRQKILEGVTQPHVTFRNAIETLDKIKDAIKISAPRSIIADILEEGGAASTAKEGQAIMASLETSLNSGDLALLSSILMWLVGSEGKRMELETLEAALRLEQADLPIEPLAKKIEYTLHRAIAWRGNYFVELQPAIEAFLLARHEHTQLEGTEPLITMDISIRNATSSAITQFVRNLHENLASVRFEVNGVTMKTRETHMSKLATHMTIVRLCFKILSEGWSDDTKGMVSYAQSEIPRQLVLLQRIQQSVGKADRRLIGEGLIALLRDPHAFEERHENYPDIGRWISDEDKINAFRFWLQDQETVLQLPIKERRWVSEAMNMKNGKLSFLCDLTRSACIYWLTDRKSPSVTLAQWLYGYCQAVKSLEEKEEQGRKTPQEDESQPGNPQRDTEADGNILELKDDKLTPITDHSVTQIPTDKFPLEIDDSKDVMPEYEKLNLRFYDDEYVSVLTEVVRKHFEPRKDAVYHYAWARECRWYGYPARAAGHLNQALQLAEVNVDDESKISISYLLLELAGCKEDLKNLDAAFELASRSLATFEQLRCNGKLTVAFDEDQYVRWLWYWADVFERGHPNQALQWYEGLCSCQERSDAPQMPLGDLETTLQH